MLEERPALVYAIGDVHGCLAELLELERLIVADAAGIDGDKLLVTLGDYVDRGPQSGQVIEHLLGPAPQGFRRVVLLGNHEQMLLDFLADPLGDPDWLDNGAAATFASYGTEPLESFRGSVAAAAALTAAMPVAHREFLEGLPTLLSMPGYAFAHAGIVPGVPLDKQADDNLIWIRKPFLTAEAVLEGTIVVHGHTPGKAPVVKPTRIGIDTTAYSTGRLTALRIPVAGEVSFITTPGRAGQSQVS